MKKTVLVCILLLSLQANLFAVEHLRIRESMAMYSHILNQEVHFSVCLPEAYFADEKRYPVVYLLHGLGDDETSWLEYGRIRQYADKAVESGEAIPMIFVMPEAFRTYYVNDYAGSFLYQDMFVNELVPFVDSLFRTLSGKNHRAVMGYSMGGFGALNLHLKHPELFGISVPLSMSVRTDEQYMSEEASGWDDQWGRLFGASGLKGADRITAYYRNHSPFYIFPSLSAASKSNLKIYMVNGDEEQTLCRSNEELHILMHEHGIPHEYRVVDGGHSFRVWCDALPGALRFISDAFESKPYRGDQADTPALKPLPAGQKLALSLNNMQVTAFVPYDYAVSDRKYPVLYVAGGFTDDQKATLSALVNYKIKKNQICPMILVFIPAFDTGTMRVVLPLCEEKLRARKGFRMRAIAGYQNEGPRVLNTVLNQLQFSSCILLDAHIMKDNLTGLISDMTTSALKRTQLIIDVPDKSNFAAGNGNLHMILRDMEIPHEYRVRQGDGSFDQLLEGMNEIISLTAARFHR